MTTRIQERIVIVALACTTAIVVHYADDMDADTPLVVAPTPLVIRRDIETRMAALERDVRQAEVTCAYARTEAALADSKAGYLRAMVRVLYRRLGQQRMPRGLAEWPGVASEMKGVR